MGGYPNAAASMHSTQAHVTGQRVKQACYGFDSVKYRTHTELCSISFYFGIKLNYLGIYQASYLLIIKQQGYITEEEKIHWQHLEHLGQNPTFYHYQQDSNEIVMHNSAGTTVSFTAGSQGNNGASQLCTGTILKKKSKRLFHQYVFILTLKCLILEGHLAAFREVTFLTVLNPTLTPRHPTAERAHAMHTRTCPAPSHPCSVERVFVPGPRPQMQSNETKHPQNALEEVAQASYKAALCMRATTCSSNLIIFRHALVGYTA